MNGFHLRYVLSLLSLIMSFWTVFSYGNDNHTALMSSYGRGLELYNQSKFEEALPEFFEFLESADPERVPFEKINDAINLILLSYNNLAMDCADNEEYEDAIAYSKELVDFLELIDTENILYVKTLNDISLFYTEINDIQNAVDYGIKTAAAYKNIQDIASESDILFPIDYLVYFEEIKDYPNAVKFATVALMVHKETEGCENLEYIRILTKLADYYSSLNNNDACFTYLKEAIELMDFLGLSQTQDHINILTIYARLLNNVGEIEGAIELSVRALNICDHLYETDNIQVAISLDNLAYYLCYIEEYEDALDLSKQALDILERLNEKESIHYITTLNNISLCNFCLKNYEEALRIEKEVLESQEKQFGTSHPQLMTTYSNLALYSYNASKLPELEKFSRETTNRIKDTVKKNFQNLTSEERTAFWNKQKTWFELLTHEFAYKHETAPLISSAFDALLVSKGLLLSSDIEFSEILHSSKNEGILDKYNELVRIQALLNRQYEKPKGERTLDVDSLERTASALERELMYASKEYGDYTRNLSITWQDVQKALGDKDVAIEFASFPLTADSTIYMAYLVKPGMESPVLVKLFEEKELKPYVSNRRYEDAAATELVWSALRPYMDEGGNVYFSPDGLLHQIAIEYFPGFDGKGLINESYSLRRVSSTRQLAQTREASAKGDAYVYGGIAYDTDIATMEKEREKYQDHELMAVRSLWPVADAEGLLETRVNGRNIPELPGTLAEANEIHGNLEKRKYSSSLLTGDKATEESFKYISGRSPEIIHIGTHGFYWEKEEADKISTWNDRLMFLSDTEDVLPYAEDKAMTRSGLMMAGAGNIFRGVEIPEGVDDGILTAREISQMNLRGTDLVVLSACQTGMGEISGDGVFGLQRGFKKAGVGTLLMSLWNVDDAATRLLMTTFYDLYLGGESKRKALELAQKAVKDTPGFSHPNFWAAFILLDDLN